MGDERKKTKSRILPLSNFRSLGTSCTKLVYENCIKCAHVTLLSKPMNVLDEQDTIALSMGKTDSDSSEAMPFPDNFMPNGLDIKFEEQQVPAPGKQGRTSLEIFQNSFRDFSVRLYFYFLEAGSQETRYNTFGVEEALSLFF